MLKIVIQVIELIWNITHFVGIVLFGMCWVIWAIGVEGFIKLREVWNKINWDIIFCFALVIYFEMGLFFYAKAQLN